MSLSIYSYNIITCGNAIKCAVQAINLMETSRKLMRDTEERIDSKIDSKFSELMKLYNRNIGQIGYFEQN
jgi:translation initiation factor 2B subunit (eIF-2B alpha/beta/delta family)